MKIASSVVTVAVRNKISVNRDHNGIYRVWDSGNINSVRHPLIATTASGAVAKVKQLSA